MSKQAVFAIAAVCCAVAGALWYHYCQQGSNGPVSSVTMQMDTVVEQKLYGKNAKEAVREIKNRLKDFENKFSMYVQGSDVYKINESAGKGFVPVSADVYSLIERSKEFSQKTEGAFDITIAPLTQLWGITSQHPKVPDGTQVQQAKTFVDYNSILLENGQVMLAKEGQSLDLGAVAKGESCNIVRQVAEEYGITKGYVSIGGNLVVLPQTPQGKKTYYFAVRDPQGGAADSLGMLTMNGKTMATTGGYERFFEENGKLYHHVLDPATGYPAENGLLSVSVISEDGALADFLSTALFIMGKEKLPDYMDREDFSVIAVDTQNNVYISKGLKGNFIPNAQTSYHYIWGAEE